LVLLLLMTLKRITTVSGASSLSDTTYMPIWLCVRKKTRKENWKREDRSRKHT
jgi:hypothetical protein